MVPAHRTVLYRKRREATFDRSALEKRKIDARRRYFRVFIAGRDIFFTFLKKSLEKRFFVTFFEKVIRFSFFRR